jgi:predicted ATPase/class 3 adenylate cyclase
MVESPYGGTVEPMSRLLLPTGTVTFVFTDIEGSTRLVQTLGEAWVGALDDHNRLVRRAIEDRGGTVVKTEGDSFFAVFPAAADALVAAADAQRALAAHPWPDDSAVRSRIGVHTGTGVLGGDDYVGIDVHRAARIAAAAHGGQTVLSEATAVLAERGIPDELALRDLGKHRLKDLAQPEAIFQLVVPGLQEEFPVLNTLDAIPNNLPAIGTSFVGREDELAEALRLLEATRVLTLTGPGGTGKTRLALQVGAELGATFRSGVFFVDLAPVSDVDVVPTQVLNSLGLQAPIGTRSPTDALLEHLGDKEVLLILDNFEQIIGAAPLVAELARISSRSKFVVTSRGPLHISGEQEMPVRPLEVPDGSVESLLDVDAARLFVERAMAVRPDFELTPANAAAVAELVRRLDGLPLAIELVAPQVRLLPVGTIVERLGNRILSSGAVDLPERQRTITAAIDWSHDLLDEPHRTLFWRLSVFSGGGGIEEVEQVCGGDGSSDVLEGLGVLLDQSLIFPVEREGRSRIRMLQVIRQYAAERLAESGEAESIKGRHLEVCTALAEEMAANVLGHDRKLHLDRIAADHDNVRAANDWAVEAGDSERALRLTAAMWRFWQARGHLLEARRRLEAALAMPGGTLASRAKATEALGGVLWWQGGVHECLATYRRALEMQRQVGDPGEIANALYNMALAVDFASPQGGTGVAESVAMLDEAEEIYRRLGDVGGLGDVAWGRGNAYLIDRDFAKAVEPFEASVDYYEQAGNEFGRGWGLYELGFVAIRRGDLEAAGRYFHDGLSLFAAHHDESAAVMFVAGLAGLAQEQGDEEEKLRLAGAFHSMRITTGTDLVTYTINLPPGLEYETMEALTGEHAEWYRQGKAMGYDEAVAYALACCSP